MAVERKQIYRGKVVDLWLETVDLPNGNRVPLEVIHHPGAAAVVPLHADGSVTLIRQFRHAAGGFIWEVPAGKLDGEDPAVCALRELAEEAGLHTNRLTRLGAILTTPGFTDERIHLFLAEELSPTPQKLEHDEVLSVHRIPWQEALAMVARGELVDAKSVAALFLADLHLAARKQAQP
jgi:ADP-ribose pyrophosphatase